MNARRRQRGLPLAGSQRGLSLVELLVGSTVGLFVAAATGLLAVNQLADNRRLLLETQVQQDLRAAADIVVREIRRAGFHSAAEAWVWQPGASPAGNPNQAIELPAPGEIGFRYDRLPDGSGAHGFRLDTNNATLKVRIGGSGWQDLTDRRTLRVTAFSVTDQSPPPTALPCPRLCADGSRDCWPVLRVRDLRVQIAGQATNDAAVQREVVTHVRVRNDAVHTEAAGVCP